MRKECILVSRSNGRSKRFPSETAAAEWLGWTQDYIAYRKKRDSIVYKKDGTESFKVVTDGMEIFLSPRNGQLCTYCEKYAKGCEWSERFEPVPGWEAVPTIINQKGKPIHSYRIIRCPKFVEG